MDRTVRSIEDIFALLDGLFTSESENGRMSTGDGEDFWDRFYADRSRPVSFFVPKPDENLAAYLSRGLIAPGRALDLGCGPGRNALYLALRGFDVDAVDLSPVAITWVQDRAHEAGADVRFLCGDAFCPVRHGSGRSVRLDRRLGMLPSPAAAPPHQLPGSAGSRPGSRRAPRAYVLRGR